MSPIALPLFALLTASPAPDFNRDIRPILSNHCNACHGPDEHARKADLRLDTRAGALETGVVVPGKPADSELIRRVITGEPAELMPPSKSGHTLSAKEKKLLADWVAAGAKYDQHWAYTVPTRPQVPAGGDWVRNPIDAFVARKRGNLKPAPEADRRTLARRLALDLTGLPPGVAEVDTFLADESADAYGRYVDALLAKPAFGEHWARQWLDLARYADSAGYADDPLRTVWPYRDWVINAINADLPFDEFTVKQLAGDLLPNATDADRVATAFHRNTPTNNEGGSADEEFRSVAVVDRVNTTMAVWTGTSAACAQCHTHKYDPITQTEYFRIYALFNSTADADRRDESPTIPAGGATVPVMRELPAAKRRVTKIQRRGSYLDTGDAVTPGVPAVFGALAGNPDRLALAKWLVAPANPLTARVAANRYWEALFGKGLVVTSEEFGSQGEPPTHPELLDWLARELVTPTRAGAKPWGVKSFLKLIVSSATYRQSSAADAESLAADPDNRLLTRGARLRLSAEAVRDQALCASGLLGAKVGGPSVRPVQPKSGLSAAFGGKIDWQTSKGEDAHRRGIYTEWRRSNPYPSMATFDAPARDACTIRRGRTNTPLQALVTLNDDAFVEAAQAFGRVMLAVPGSDRDKLNAGFLRLLSRPATESELSRLRELLAVSRATYRDSPGEAVKLAGGEADAPERAAWALVGNVLLNLDEALMRR